MSPLSLVQVIPHFCGMSKRFREKRLVASVRAFFDESAVSPEQGPGLIFGGFVGYFREFERASEAWQECLDKSPELTYFHHKEPQSKFKVVPLATVISQFNLQPFIATVPHAPFLNRDSAAAKGQFGSRIYDWGFIRVVTGVLAWVDEMFPKGEKVDFIFGAGRKELNLCRSQFFDPYCSEGNGIWARAGTCTPADDKEVQALQMGDLLAGEVLGHIKTGETPVGLSKIASVKPILLLNQNPPPIMEKALTLQNIGKRLFDSGREKIMACPPDNVPLAVFKQELYALFAIKQMMEEYMNEAEAHEDKPGGP
jgi:hypothetical protein